MIINKDVLICVLILFLAQIVVWFQLNGQLKWDWWKDNIWIVCLMGVPLSYLFWLATKYGFNGFGELWPIRLMGFATGMMTFPFITYFVLGEGITIKTGISICLAIIIMTLQLIKI